MEGGPNKKMEGRNIWPGHSQVFSQGNGLNSAGVGGGTKVNLTGGVIWDRVVQGAQWCEGSNQNKKTTKLEKRGTEKKPHWLPQKEPQKGVSPGACYLVKI